MEYWDFYWALYPIGNAVSFVLAMVYVFVHVRHATPGSKDGSKEDGKCCAFQGNRVKRF